MAPDANFELMLYNPFTVNNKKLTEKHANFKATIKTKLVLLENATMYF